LKVLWPCFQFEYNCLLSIIEDTVPLSDIYVICIIVIISITKNCITLVSIYHCRLGLILCISLGLIIKTELSAKMISPLKLFGAAPKHLALQLRFRLKHQYHYESFLSLIRVTNCVVFWSFWFHCRFLPMFFLFIMVLQVVLILKSKPTFLQYRFQLPTLDN